MKKDRLAQAEPDEPPDDELMHPHQIISLKGTFWLNEGKQIGRFMDQLLRKPAVITGQLKLLLHLHCQLCVPLSHFIRLVLTVGLNSQSNPEFFDNKMSFSSVWLQLAVCAECVHRTVNTSWGSFYNLQKSNMSDTKSNQTARTAEGAGRWLTRGWYFVQTCLRSADVCLVGQGHNVRSDFRLKRVVKQ